MPLPSPPHPGASLGTSRIRNTELFQLSFYGKAGKEASTPSDNLYSVKSPFFTGLLIFIVIVLSLCEEMFLKVLEGDFWAQFHSNTNRKPKSPHPSLLFSKLEHPRPEGFTWIPSLPIPTWQSCLLMKPGGVKSPPHAPVKSHRLQMNGTAVFDPRFPSHSIPPLQISSSPPHKRIFCPRNAVPALLMGSGPFFFQVFFFHFLIHFIAPGEGGFPSGSCVMQSKNNSRALPPCAPRAWEGTTSIPLQGWREGETLPNPDLYKYILYNSH